ncbi:SprT family zinc-dependent metalloprotease [Paraglaciecola sp. 2405UD69-4]|uniref:SprT family zinc-dependent metalloprotease n=1 Tax=Paraglaciecola sp. 2405UD69-4 TaxID=3391836 RepID=UPI0039C9A654
MTSTPQQIAPLVQHRVEQCYLIAEDYFKRNFERPKVLLSQRGKVAGSARLQSNELRLNLRLLEDNFNEFMIEVIPHEICHLLTYEIYGRVKPHGKEWQALMIHLFKLTPKTRHNMDVSKVAGKTFSYYCSCGSVDLSIRRHNKVVRAKQQYVCRRCNDILKPSLG